MGGAQGEVNSMLLIKQLAVIGSTLRRRSRRRRPS
jgi:hypothetical protein